MTHDIFISYSSKHRELTRQLAVALEAQYGAGAVWWDTALEARGPFQQQIHAALVAARAVVVVWTADAQISEWVYAEAAFAHAAHKLVSVRPADTAFAQLPAPFNIHQVEDLGATERILVAVASVLAGRPLPTIIPLHELYLRQHGQRLVNPKQIPLPQDLSDISPSHLLLACHAQVCFLDVNGERAALLDWALRHPRQAAGRLVHGPGGVGKTRLLIEVAAALRREHRWMGGFVDPLPPRADEAQRRQRQQALRQLVEFGEEPGLLLVLDYAEGRRDEVLDLAQWIEGRPEPERRRVRLVALARSAGDWWTRLTDERSELQRLFRPLPEWTAVRELPSLHSSELRLALFEASCAAYRPVLAAQDFRRPSDGAPEPLLQRIVSGDSRSSPLSIQMEALMWLTGGGSEGALFGVGSLLDQVLGLERRHWARVLAPIDEAGVRELERGLAQLTLVQGVADRSAAEALLALDSHYGVRRQAPAETASVVDRLGQLYGVRGEGLRPLEPDLLGEQLIANVADTRLLKACIAWVDALDEASLGDAHASRRQLVTVLQRATAPERGTDKVARVIPLIDGLLSNHLAGWAPAVVSTLIETPGAMLSRLLALVPELNVPAAAALEEALPLHSIVLDELALQVASRRLQLQRAEASAGSPGETEHLSGLAACCDFYGVRLSAMGHHEAAVSASGEAVNIYRNLTKDQPDSFLPYLAHSLNHLGIWMSDVGNLEAALRATEEAVQIYRSLAQECPDAVMPDLARGLNNLGTRLLDLGNLDAALATTEEAVQIERSLALERPDSFLPNVATGLNNMGIMLSDLGRCEDALAVAQEAVQIRRSLALDRPDAFLPNLASSLSNLGKILSDLGRREAALAVADEAVQIDRCLAQSRPAAFLPKLACSLGRLSQVLADANRYAEAALSSEEGLAALMPMVKLHPAAYQTLASALARNHRKAAEAAAQGPNTALLAEIERLVEPREHDQPEMLPPLQ